MKKTIGGDRLGSGKKMKAELHGYGRSNHNLDYVFRNTQAPGTLVPFMCELGLPGDTFDIDLNANVLTHPTVGPLYGSYKVQLDVFTIPFRLYNRDMMMNKVKVGLTPENIKIPQVELWADPLDIEAEDQINPSCLMAYLGARGLGRAQNLGVRTSIRRLFNAVPLLGYWDIYKNYYANQQEGKGAVIHTKMYQDPVITNSQIQLLNANLIAYPQGKYNEPIELPNQSDWIGLKLKFTEQNNTASVEVYENTIAICDASGNWHRLKDIFHKGTKAGTIYTTGDIKIDKMGYGLRGWQFISSRLTNVPEESPKVEMFDLKGIDDQKEDIMRSFQATYIVNAAGFKPTNLMLERGLNTVSGMVWPAIRNNQEGLAVKTYQNDIFNNWLATEWVSSIDSISAVAVNDNSFTVNSLNMANKVFQMLTRIAMSGGTYNDYLETTYDEQVWTQTSTPVYVGGLSKELIFQEVVATTAAQTEDASQVLGQLGGKGRLSDKHKGGSMVISIKEPSYIMGIVSLTPRVDYSQGNRFDVNIRSLADLHRPQLDEIGFQDLITDKMATFDTMISNGSDPLTSLPIFRSAGKQPAWIDYMTNYNRNFGNFALKENEMFMTLNRRYERADDNRIKDLTSYVDPAKFNFIFAETNTDAMNFWVQIACDINARRKMSAKVMPNL